MIGEAEKKGLLQKKLQTSGTPVYVIPVAVHIVHQGGPENITDAQVLSQIDALNRDSGNLLHHASPANDAGIRFCLAQNLPSGSAVTWSTTPGITRTNSSQTINTFANLSSETALKAIDYLPSDRYLNIWVVKQILGGSGGIVGYGTFPGTVPQALDGIVMAYSVFGSNTTGHGTFPSLLPSNNDGKVLAHEVGHYLNLYHTFQGGCTSPGDYVSDTTSEGVNNSGCPSLTPTSCTTAPDPIENFMDYTDDTCRFAFTAGQAARMQAAISLSRQLLVSGGNLLFTGCSSGLNALISATPGQICTNGTIHFSTPAAGAGYSYAWTFTGGTPAAATTQNASSQFATSGPHTVTLTVTDSSSNSSTTNTTIYVVNCTPITGPCTNWVFSSKCRLDFSSGVPVAVNGTQNQGLEAAAQISGNAGNLLFYSDATNVWDKNNNVMPNGSGIFGGNSSHNGAIIVPRPGSSTQYFLFTISQEENGSVPNPVRVTTVDMALPNAGDVVTTEKNVPVTLPGNPTFMLEGQTLVPHCNGVDWWYITHGARSSASSNWSGNVYVTLVTSAGATSSTAYPIGIGFGGVNSAGTITASRDGSKIAAVHWPDGEGGAICVYNFDRATGVLTQTLNTGGIGAYLDVAFSPNGKILYYTYWPGNAFELRQLEIATSQIRTLGSSGQDLELGPDGKLYVGVPAGYAIGVVNFPDNFNILNANECGYNPGSIPLGAGVGAFFGELPNTLQMCRATQAAQFSYCFSYCLTVQFQTPNCAGPYNWNFGDASSGAGQTVTHTYANPGNYNVTLTVPGANPPTMTISITLGSPPVTIAGPSNACTQPANYSVNGPANYNYQWTIAGGAPTTATGNNVDVTWGASSGTVTVLATDPNTGCSSTATINVTPCPTCVPAPANMVAWYPFDEFSGSTAHDVAGYPNDGTQVSGPVSTAGIVNRALLFNGLNDYVTVPTQSELNFSKGSLSIDVWVKPTQISGVRPIVDKRTGPSSTPLGFTLFLYNGRLGFQLGNSNGFQNYISNASVPVGTWSHVAAVVNRTTSPGVKLYIGGAPQTLSTTASLILGSVDNVAPLWIGRHCFSSLFFAGAIDELEIFKRALSQGEIQSIVNAASAGKCRPCAAPPAGMVAWYPLGESPGVTTINDIAPAPASTFNNIGTPQPGAINPPIPSPTGPAAVAGEVGGALFFYGPSNPYIEVAPNTELDFSSGNFSVDTGSTAFSIDAWVRIVQVGPTLIQPIVDKFNSSAGQGFAFYIRNQHLELNLNGNTFVSTGLPIAFANPLANTGPWYHVAVTVRGGERFPGQGSFYVNGSPAGNFAPNLGTSVNNNLPLWIGATRISSSRGEIALDEVELFKSALAPSDIQSIVNAAGSGKCNPCHFCTEAIQNLMNLLNRIGVRNNVKNDLVTLLASGKTDDIAITCGKLNKLIEKVNASEGKGELSARQANQVRELAEKSKASLSCR